MCRIRGATLYVHWSVLAVTAVLTLAAIEDALSTLFLIAAYLGLLLLHEYGHLLAAHRVRSRVTSIELYPFHGITRFDAPWTHLETCVVAWGGVLAQAAVAAPLILWAQIVGFTPFGPINAVMVVFGYYSGLMVVLNLLPVPGLDGATAWRIVPHQWRRARKTRRRTTGWR